MRVAGIDPGKHGALAIIENGVVISAQAFPLIGDEVDWTAIDDLLVTLTPDLAMIEKVGAMPGQGVTSMFSFGENVGLLRGLLTGHKIPSHRVTPQAWMKLVLAGEDRKASRAAIRYCQRAYPSVSLLATPRSRVPHDGIADAICIAEFGWRTFGRTTATVGS